MLLVLLTIAAGGIPLIENPGSTLIHLSDRFQTVVALLRARGIRSPDWFQNCFVMILWCNWSWTPKRFSDLIVLLNHSFHCIQQPCGNTGTRCYYPNLFDQCSNTLDMTKHTYPILVDCSSSPFAHAASAGLRFVPPSFLDEALRPHVLEKDSGLEH